MDILSDALRQGIAPAIVVAIYLIITKIIDNRRESAQIKLSTELTKSINSISDFVIGITKNIISCDKEKCKIPSLLLELRANFVMALASACST